LEEVSWRQKLWALWLKKEDRNTKVLSFSAKVLEGPLCFFLGKLGPQDKSYRKSTKFFTNLHSITMKALSKMLFATVDGGFLLGFSVGSRNIGVLHISHSFVCE
jgi:hypothetical protein